MSDETNKNSTMKAVTIVLLCLFAVIGAIWFASWKEKNPTAIFPKDRFTPQYRVPLEQMVTLASALKAYTDKNGKRPETLDELVTSNIIERKMLFEPSRKNVSAIKEGPYDVIYNPAVLPTDPKNSIILHTLFVSKQGEPFYAVHNDYTVSKFKPRELVKALNDTYQIIGEDIAKKQHATTQTTK